MLKVIAIDVEGGEWVIRTTHAIVKLFSKEIAVVRPVVLKSPDDLSWESVNGRIRYDNETDTMYIKTPTSGAIGIFSHN